MNGESILNGAWTPCFPNPALAPSFRLENGKLEMASGDEGRVFGYCESRVEALPEAYYRFDVAFFLNANQPLPSGGMSDPYANTNLLRSVLCLVEWETGRGAGRLNAQEIMSKFLLRDETVYGSLICRAPRGTRCAKLQLGLRYAANMKIVFCGAVWHETEPPKPRKAKIGVCRWNPAKEEGADAYHAQLARLLESAGVAACDLFLLPEFCDTYHWKENLLSAVALTDNPTVKTAAEYARKHHMYVIAPVAERDGDCVFNTSALIGRDGRLAGKYRKTHLYWPEVCCWGLTPGDDFPVFHLDFGKIGIETCYDNWNADVCKLLALKGAELILMPNEGYDPLLMPARAVDNRVYMAVSSLAFEGEVYNAKGEKIGREEGMIKTAEIDMDERIPPYPVAGGCCNYAMGARRSVHNSVSDRLYRELALAFNKWENTDEGFIDPRGDISGDLAR